MVSSVAAQGQWRSIAGIMLARSRENKSVPVDDVFPFVQMLRDIIQLIDHLRSLLVPQHSWLEIDHGIINGNGVNPGIEKSILAH